MAPVEKKGSIVFRVGGTASDFEVFFSRREDAALLAEKLGGVGQEVQVDAVRIEDFRLYRYTLDLRNNKGCGEEKWSVNAQESEAGTSYIVQSTPWSKPHTIIAEASTPELAELFARCRVDEARQTIILPRPAHWTAAESRVGDRRRKHRFQADGSIHTEGV